MKFNIRELVILILTIVLSHSAGIIGLIFTVSNIDSWYNYLNKPFFTPPNWLFGPAWLILYTLMGISLFLVLKKVDFKIDKLSVMFLIHLVFNALWSIVFFGFQQLFLGFLIIVIVDIFIFAMMIMFWKRSKLASFLLVPYFCWVTFASALNFGVMVLN